MVSAFLNLGFDFNAKQFGPIPSYNKMQMVARPCTFPRLELKNKEVDPHQALLATLNWHFRELSTNKSEINLGLGVSCTCWRKQHCSTGVLGFVSYHWNYDMKEYGPTEFLNRGFWLFLHCQRHGSLFKLIKLFLFPHEFKETGLYKLLTRHKELCFFK